MEGNSSEQLNAPLWEPIATGTADDVHRYDKLGSTSPRPFSGKSLSSIATDPTTIYGGEMDSESGVISDSSAKSSSQSSQDSTLTTLVLGIIIYFSSGGGPFGMEPSLKAAGNLYAIIGFAAMTFVWALPEAVMTYELSSLYPCSSGGVRWVEEAFGTTCGLFTGYLGWISGVTNNATAPVLFFSYLHSHFFPDSSDTDIQWIQFGISAGIATVLVYINYRGLEVVGKASVLVFFVSIAPFVLMTIIGISKVDPQKWLQTPTGEEEIFDDDTMTQPGWVPDTILGGIALRPFINNLYWNFNGFDQGSHFSNEVPKRTLRNGLCLSVLLVSTTTIIPILIATGATDIEQADWKAGTFALAGAEIGGRWLGTLIVVASGISLLATFISGMSADSLQLQGMADRGQLPSIFRSRSPHDTPTYALILGLFVVVLMLPLPFGFIVELSNFSYCISIIIEFLAFAQLRIRRGDGTMLRKTVYALLLIAPMLFNIAVLMLASYATYIYGACASALGALLILTTVSDSSSL